MPIEKLDKHDAAGDVMWLEDIKELQDKELDAQELQTAMQLECEFVKGLAYFKHCGAHLDVDKWKVKMQKDLDKLKKETTDVSRVIIESVDKFKLQTPDVKWDIILQDKKCVYRGTFDMWEAIIDNLLNNFVRYANETIKITIKNNKIILYNDGPNIDPNILNDIFTPYKKGVKGQFGLGLSIVKKTIMLLGYEISVHNEKKGISFIIK